MSTFGVHHTRRRSGNTMTLDLAPGSDADIARGIARLFERAVAEPSALTMGELREATVALATAMRASAVQPERAVIMLKEVLRGHGGAGWAPSIAAHRAAEPSCPESLVYGELFTWWVDAYYGERPPELTTPRESAPIVGA